MAKITGNPSDPKFWTDVAAYSLEQDPSPPYYTSGNVTWGLNKTFLFSFEDEAWDAEHLSYVYSKLSKLV